MQRYHKPAVVCEGLGTLRTATEMREHYALQMCRKDKDPLAGDPVELPGMLSALRTIDDNAADALLRYQIALSVFDHKINEIDADAAQIIQALLKLHAENKDALKSGYQVFLNNIPVSEVSIGAYCFAEMNHARKCFLNGSVNASSMRPALLDHSHAVSALNSKRQLNLSAGESDSISLRRS